PDFPPAPTAPAPPAPPRPAASRKLRRSAGLVFISSLLLCLGSVKLERFDFKCGEGAPEGGHDAVVARLLRACERGEKPGERGLHVTLEKAALLLDGGGRAPGPAGDQHAHRFEESREVVLRLRGFATDRQPQRGEVPLGGHAGT